MAKQSTVMKRACCLRRYSPVGKMPNPMAENRAFSLILNFIFFKKQQFLVLKYLPLDRSVDLYISIRYISKSHRDRYVYDRL